MSDEKHFPLVIRYDGEGYPKFMVGDNHLDMITHVNISIDPTHGIQTNLSVMIGSFEFAGTKTPAESVLDYRKLLLSLLQQYREETVEDRAVDYLEMELEEKLGRAGE